MKHSTRGALLVALSALFFGSYGVWVRLIGSNLDNFFQVYVRSMLILAVLLPLGYVTKSFSAIRREDIKWYVLYTLSASLTLAPAFYATNIIGIGATILLFYVAYTISSFVFGYISFGEQLTRVKNISLVIALIGLIFIFNVTIKSYTILAPLAAILAGLAAGAEVTYTKKVSDRYSVLQLNVVMWLVILVLHLGLSLYLHERQIMPHMDVAWFGVLGYSIASLSAFSLVVHGYKYVQPSVGALTGLLEIAFGIVFGVLFFHELVTPSIVFGMLCIITAAALPNVIDLIQSKR